MSDYISQTITVSSCQSDISNFGPLGGGGAGLSLTKKRGGGPKDSPGEGAGWSDHSTVRANALSQPLRDRHPSPVRGPSAGSGHRLLRRPMPREDAVLGGPWPHRMAPLVSHLRLHNASATTSYSTKSLQYSHSDVARPRRGAQHRCDPLSGRTWGGGGGLLWRRGGAAYLL